MIFLLNCFPRGGNSHNWHFGVRPGILSKLYTHCHFLSPNTFQWVMLSAVFHSNRTASRIIIICDRCYIIIMLNAVLRTCLDIDVDNTDIDEMDRCGRDRERNDRDS